MSIPNDLGYVIETHPPTSSSAPVVIHIQEAHVNYEGQKHLAQILDQLVKTYGLKLVLVEGGEGDVSLTKLRHYGSPESRRQVAETYLQSGIISGEEYLDVVSDYPLMLWGVEQEGLYQQNVQAFLDAESLRERLRPALEPFHQAIAALRPVVADPALLTLEEKARAFDAGTLDLGSYVDVLADLAAEHRMAIDSASHLAQFLAVRNLEGTIRAKETQQEQHDLVAQLTRALTASEMKALTDTVQALKEDQISRDAFYADLKRLAASVDLSLQSYPNLARYIAYREESARIKPSALAGELDNLAARLRAELTLRPTQQRLARIEEQLDLFEKCLALKLSPSEYQRLQTIGLAGLWSEAPAFLSEQLAQHGLAPQTFERLAELEAALPILQRFYGAAHQRDEVFVARAIEKLTETGEPIAALITGGFHSPNITQQFKNHGVGVVVVVPKVGDANDDALYHAVLKYKNGQGTFEAVQIAAGHPVEQGSAYAQELHSPQGARSR